MQGLGSFVPLILLVVVFYFLLIRPQRKRQQEQAQMQSNLVPGTRVMTTTGLFATVVEQLGKAKLTEQPTRDDGQPASWRRVVIEKPFGHSLASGW